MLYVAEPQRHPHRPYPPNTMLHWTIIKNPMTSSPQEDPELVRLEMECSGLDEARCYAYDPTARTFCMLRHISDDRFTLHRFDVEDRSISDPTTLRYRDTLPVELPTRSIQQLWFDGTHAGRLYVRDGRWIWIAQIQTSPNEHKSSSFSLSAASSATTNAYVELVAKCKLYGPSHYLAIDEEALRHGKKLRAACYTPMKSKLVFYVCEFDLSSLNHASASASDRGTDVPDLERSVVRYQFPRYIEIARWFFYGNYIYVCTSEGDVHAYSLFHRREEYAFRMVYDVIVKPARSARDVVHGPAYTPSIEPPRLVHDAHNNRLVLSAADREMWFPLHPTPKLQIHSTSARPSLPAKS